MDHRMVVSEGGDVFLLLVLVLGQDEEARPNGIVRLGSQRGRYFLIRPVLADLLTCCSTDARNNRYGPPHGRDHRCDRDGLSHLMAGSA